MLNSTKTFIGYPCAHRQHKHPGNCALVHGYSRSFHFVFGAVERDVCGFVVDFGDLKFVKAILDAQFDHTLLLNAEDPCLPNFLELEKLGACDIRIMSYGVGMEGTAQWLYEQVDPWLRRRSRGRAWVVSVEARENEKNSAIFTSDLGFLGWDTYPTPEAP